MNNKLNDDNVFFKKFGNLISEYAKATGDSFFKIMSSDIELTEKIRDLMDSKKMNDKEYCDKLYNFLNQLNSLTDDFIKENK